MVGSLPRLFCKKLYPQGFSKLTVKLLAIYVAGIALWTGGYSLVWTNYHKKIKRVENTMPRNLFSTSRQDYKKFKERRKKLLQQLKKSQITDLKNYTLFQDYFKKRARKGIDLRLGDEIRLFKLKGILAHLWLILEIFLLWSGVWAVTTWNQKDDKNQL